jgi:predicted nucleic acid-binding protein
MTKPLFLDTSVIIDAFVGTSEDAFRLLFESKESLHTIDYVMKEIYHVMRNKYNYSEVQVNRVRDAIRTRVTIHKNPPVKALCKLDIRDSSDKPIVYAARSLGCILVLSDEVTRTDAQKYVKVRRLADLIG